MIAFMLLIIHRILSKKNFYKNKISVALFIKQ